MSEPYLPATSGNAIQNKNGRDPKQRWYTPMYLARAHVKHALKWMGPQPRGTIWNDPFAGSGRYILACEEVGLVATGQDIDPRCWGVTKQAYVGKNPGAGDITITNPPFDLVGELLANRKGPTSLLLPMSSLGSAEREGLWLADPPHVIVNVGRHKFDGPALDMKIAAGSKAPGAMQDYVFVTWPRELGVVPLKTEFHWQRIQGERT